MVRKRRQALWNEKLIMEKGFEGRRAFIPHKENIPHMELSEEWKRKTPANLPEVSELELVRHVVRLSQMNHGVDVGPYLLGSCTMKYNPKINEKIAHFDQFGMMHPDAPSEVMQGNIEVIFRLQEVLKKITGFSGVSVQPAAGAQGEYVGMLITRAYHEENGNFTRNRVLIPDSAHGTNPASAAMVGYKVVELPSDENGFVNLEALGAALDDTVAAFMITNPNTLGLFEANILQITKMVHDAGALVYLDGANFNGVIGMMKSVDMGFDIQHFNMHKTFSGPHGGGGPGCGPVGVIEKLTKYLPKPLAVYNKEENTYDFDYDMPHSIGRVHGYFGNFGIILRSLAYIYRNGGIGLRKVCESAVLNSNYLMEKMREIRGFVIPKAPGVPRKHEFIASPVPMMNETGINAGDVAKAMLDYGIHSPTVYFPLIVKEALLIEPTEGETKDDLDHIIAVFREISDLAYSNSKEVKKMPFTTARRRLDEYNLAKNPKLSSRQKQN